MVGSSLGLVLVVQGFMLEYVYRLVPFFLSIIAGISAMNRIMLPMSNIVSRAIMFSCTSNISAISPLTMPPTTFEVPWIIPLMLCTSDSCPLEL